MVAALVESTRTRPVATRVRIAASTVSAPELVNTQRASPAGARRTSSSASASAWGAR